MNKTQSLIKATSSGYRLGEAFISKGNLKMSFPTFSLPARKTCPGCTKLCSKLCYAMKAERLYPSVKTCRQRNLKATRQQKSFVSDMVAVIKKSGCQFFRIHESGDFYSQSYLNQWCAICRQLPQVKFLTFTKSFALFYGYVPGNLQIVWSIFPDTDLKKVPPGPRAFAGDCSNMPKRIIECPGNCDRCQACWGISKLNIPVHFSIH